MSRAGEMKFTLFGPAITLALFGCHREPPPTVANVQDIENAVAFAQEEANESKAEKLAEARNSAATELPGRH
jgi:hypothetical protein